MLADGRVACAYAAAKTLFVAEYNPGDANSGPMRDVLLAFDLDGTLVDSLPDLTNSLNQVLREHGYVPPLSRHDVAPMVGDGVPALVARAFAARGGGAAEAAEALPRYIKVYEANAVNETRPFAGVPETLRELRHRGYRTAVCTNKLQQATRTVLDGLGLAELFDAVAGGDHYRVKKPDPGHLTGLVRELGGSVERMAMIGDSENDAAAAHAAGVRLVLMRYGYARAAPESLGADAVLDEFGELPQALERLGITP